MAERKIAIERIEV